MGSNHENGSSGFPSYYHDYADSSPDRMPQSGHHQQQHQPDGYPDNGYGGPSRPSIHDSQFDILDWHPAYQSCQRYFLDHAQYEPASQAVCALINIRLPFQWLNNPVTSSTPSYSVPAAISSGGVAGSSSFNLGANASYTTSRLPPHHHHHNPTAPPAPCFVSPVPYIRRLVVTGFDRPAILHGFFGDDYVRGIMPHVECERRNYLFAAKHGGWRHCKKQYDPGSGGGGGGAGGAGADESVPFMKPLDGVSMDELNAAEKAWSAWLAMEDWMVGPRAPVDEFGVEEVGQRQRQEQEQRQQQQSQHGQGHGQGQGQGQPQPQHAHVRSGSSSRRGQLPDGL